MKSPQTTVVPETVLVDLSPRIDVVPLMTLDKNLMLANTFIKKGRMLV